MKIEKRLELRRADVATIQQRLDELKKITFPTSEEDRIDYTRKLIGDEFLQPKLLQWTENVAGIQEGETFLSIQAKVREYRRRTAGVDPESLVVCIGSDFEDHYIGRRMEQMQTPEQAYANALRVADYHILTEQNKVGKAILEAERSLRRALRHVENIQAAIQNIESLGRAQ